jgi:hydroxymethylpyrimidine pyrophosphatase-like HAD family hydrolase
VTGRHLYRALVTDYDGTLTSGGRPRADVLAALARFRRAGNRTILATGRIVAELLTEFPDVDDHVDALVAENGAVIRRRDRTWRITEPIGDDLAHVLGEAGVEHRRGDVLLATTMAHFDAVAHAVSQLGREYQLVQNRGELMVLPPGVSKGAGVVAALDDLGTSRHNAIAVGDAENDHTLLDACELGVAVGNAVPSLRARADLVMAGDAGDGVVELLHRLDTNAVHDGGPTDPLAVVARRWRVNLGVEPDGTTPVEIAPAHSTTLIVGPTQSGKSYVAGLIAEQTAELGYTVLVVDPEGDYSGLCEVCGVVHVGGDEPIGSIRHLIHLVESGHVGVVIDLSHRPLHERAAFIHDAPALIAVRRTATGVPHWVLVDEAHLMFATNGQGRRRVALSGGLCLVTYRPEAMADDLLDAVDTLVALPGTDCGGWLDRLSADADAVRAAVTTCEPGEAVLARRHGDVVRFTTGTRRRAHQRHWHKYLNEPLPPDRRFYARDGRDRVVGVAANLADMHNLLGECDDSVIEHHAVRGDLSHWIVGVFADDDLAAEFAAAERAVVVGGATPADLALARKRMTQAIAQRYLTS